MAKTIWVDPSRLAFALCGCLPLISIAIYDEVQGNYSAPLLIISMNLFSFGTIIYMRSKHPWQRGFVLYSTAIISELLNSFAVIICWDSRIIEPWMNSPLRWQNELKDAIMFMIYQTLFFLGSVLIIDLI